MDEIEIGSIENLRGFWLVALLGAVGLVSVWQRRRAIAALASPNLRRRLVDGRWLVRTVLSTFLAIAAAALLVLCTIDIRWGQVERAVPQSGIEVMFVLDVSRSMLARDVAPNRLERAKQMIKDTLDEMAGDRVGLVLFAGETKQAIPMTSHYDDFKQRLDEVSPDNIVRGGSRLGDAISVATKGYLTKTNQHKAMVLLTDGEDMESEPVQAAMRAKEATGVTIFTIGLGDLETGSRIPVDDRGGQAYLQHDGRQVWSRLNGDILTKVATVTGGAYIPAGTKQVNMAQVYHGYVAGVEQQEFETARVNSFEARFAWFLIPATLFWIGQIVISSGIGRRPASGSAE